MTDLRDAVARYAERFHRAVGPAHHVASPLGAWLVLALAAPAADDDRLRAELDDALGMPVDEAAKTARLLLESPPDVVALAAAAWSGTSTDALRAWLATLPDEVETGPLPSQAQADAWAREHTLDLIKAFPLNMSDPVLLLVLCSAIACQISWAHPFDAVPAAKLTLPAAAGFDVGALLHAPKRTADHRTDIVQTDDGLMAAHAAWSTDKDMAVVSVIADHAVAPEVVLRHAHTLATDFARSRRFTRRVSLFDLPLGTGHSWTLIERTDTGTQHREIVDTILPAWSAKAELDLLRLGIGFDAAGQALRPLVGGDDWSAEQVAIAEYTRVGFKAAAVTVLAIRASAALRVTTAPVREARVEFTRPHAVVAVSVVRDDASPWAGLPLFSAWVTQADEA
jgi:hypothetical protein